MDNKPGFSQRRPALFGVLILIAAVALVAGAMAAFGLVDDENGAGWSLTGRDRLGQVEISGEITASEEIVTFLAELRRDASVKGVILRVNSPGGSFGPSQEIYQAVKRLEEVKPVVASFSSVAASGGYYAACPARLIYSNPGTITGSIGVMSQLANVQELLGKLGVRFESLATGELKDAGSPFKPLTPAQKAYLEGLLADLNEQFTGAVAENRELSAENVKLISDGRAMTGKRAKDIGLVDELGGLEDAQDALKKLCGLTGKVPLVKGPKPKRRWIEELTSGLSLPAPDALALLTRLFSAQAPQALVR